MRGDQISIRHVTHSIIHRHYVSTLAVLILFCVPVGCVASAPGDRGRDTAATPPGPPALDSSALAARVRDEFVHAWNGYKTYAWGTDDLLPVSRTGRNWHGHTLYMTPVDALDTMMLMGLDEEA